VRARSVGMRAGAASPPPTVRGSAARSLGTKVLSCKPRDPGGQGAGGAGARLPGAGVFARPQLLLAGRLQHPARRVACGGEPAPALPGRQRLLADPRVWARHQTVSTRCPIAAGAPDHIAAAKTLRRDRIRLLRPATEPEVELHRPGRHRGQCRRRRRRRRPRWRSRMTGPGQHRIPGPDRGGGVLTRALKAPTLREAVARLGGRARAEGCAG
jgi:hypothetical protein